MTEYPNTLNFFRHEMNASSCIDEETKERVYQCVTKHAIKTLGDGNDCGEVGIFLAYGEGFPFTMGRYDIGDAHFDDDYNTSADVVRSLIQCFRKDGVGKNYSTLEGPSISWTARGDRFSFYVNDGKPYLFVNGTNTDDLSYFKNFSDRLDSVLAPMEVIELWKRDSN